MKINYDTPIARQLVHAIKNGHVSKLNNILMKTPELSHATIVDEHTYERSLLHIATDWPGHYPHTKMMIGRLIDFGANVNATFKGPHSETPLHWAASNNDCLAIKCLVANGANLEASGGVFYNGTPLTDARIFAQMDAAKTLVALGANTTLQDEAYIGLINQLQNSLQNHEVNQTELNIAFWNACRGEQMATAELLHHHGANINFIPDWENVSAYDLACENNNEQLIKWLKNHGAISATTRDYK